MLKIINFPIMDFIKELSQIYISLGISTGHGLFLVQVDTVS